MRAPATVIIGDHTQGLGIVRSAADAGGEIWVVNDKSISLARFSKYVNGYTRLPAGMLSQVGRADVDEMLVRALLDVPVAYPSLLCGVNEDIVSFIHRSRKRLGAKYAIPDVRLDTIVDKYLFNALLPEPLRIHTRLCSEVDLDHQAHPERLILKGRQGNGFRRVTGKKALPLTRLTIEARTQLFERLGPNEIVVQEIVETDRPVLSVCSFGVAGRLSAVFAYEKLRQHPNAFGTGTFLRSVSAGPVERLAREIHARTAFTGIAEIEFVFDRRTNSYKAIEMNPRTWKSIHFATLCEQNLVARYLTYLESGREPADTGYECDRYWADLATDIPQLIRNVERPRYPRGMFECTWRRSDPWPAFVLWTLFPLIAVEDTWSSLVAAVRARRRDSGVSVLA
jgi:predicted ATP-grasp superfamily ATP-dependent carboligase